MKTFHNILALCLLKALSLGLLSANAEDLITQDQDYIIYQLSDSDNLKDLAEKHLGGAEYILELMKYNEIENINSISAGSTIVIPKRIRSHAIKILQDAENKLTIALNASSDKYRCNANNHSSSLTSWLTDIYLYVNYNL